MPMPFDGEADGELPLNINELGLVLPVIVKVPAREGICGRGREGFGRIILNRCDSRGRMDGRGRRFRRVGMGMKRLRGRKRESRDGGIARPSRMGRDLAVMDPMGADRMRCGVMLVPPRGSLLVRKRRAGPSKRLGGIWSS